MSAKFKFIKIYSSPVQLRMIALAIEKVQYPSQTSLEWEEASSAFLFISLQDSSFAWYLSHQLSIQETNWMMCDSFKLLLDTIPVLQFPLEM